MSDFTIPGGKIRAFLNGSKIWNRIVTLMRDKSSEAIDTSAAEAISVARTEFVSVWPQRFS